MKTLIILIGGFVHKIYLLLKLAQNKKGSLHYSDFKLFSNSLLFHLH